jgi:hypothetical protein
MERAAKHIRQASQLFEVDIFARDDLRLQALDLDGQCRRTRIFAGSLSLSWPPRSSASAIATSR